MNSANYFVLACLFDHQDTYQFPEIIIFAFYFSLPKKQRKNKIHLSSRITKIKIF